MKYEFSLLDRNATVTVNDKLILGLFNDVSSTAQVM
jgi:hypothetical protein